MRITRANRKAVEYACKHFHYAKSVPTVQYAYNIYNDDDEWCGVIVFSSGATPRIGSPFGLIQGEVLELVRVALNGKQGHGNTSKAVAMALRRLHSENPLVKLIVSFADVDQDHYGVIYQATNWIYLGLVNENLLTSFIVNGKKTHRRSIGAKGVKQSLESVRKNIDPNAEAFYTKGKRKYIYIQQKREEAMAQESTSIPERR